MEDRIMYSPTSSLKHKLKHSICGCFKKGHDHDPLHHHRLKDYSNSPSPPSSRHQHPRLTRSSSSSSGGGGAHWGGGGSENTNSNIRNKCRHLISRMGHHRKSRSTDFRYDSVSYALNFDDSAHDDDGFLDDYPLRNFAARLLPSPPPPPPLIPDSALALPTSPPSATTREIAACS